MAQQAIRAERARMLRTDRLTGLSNQLGWDEALDEAMASASRFGGPLVVARIDLDDLPLRPGAPVQPLAQFAQFATRARRVVRNRDLFARLEGDTLVVALVNCPAPLAVQVLERIRRSVDEGETCSVGWAVWDRAESPQVLLERAGQALKLAQDRGGNQIVASHR